MSTNSNALIEKIKAQGFCGLDEKTYTQINYPLRIAPAICMAWAAVGTALASPIVFWSLLPFAALGAILPGHPFDVLYNYGLRHLFGTPALPRYGFRRRFACAMASIIIAAAGWGFAAGAPIVGYIAGGWLAAATMLNVTTGICLPSLFLRVFLGRPACS